MTSPQPSSVESGEATSEASTEARRRRRKDVSPSGWLVVSEGGMSALVVAPLPYPIGDEHEDEEHGDFLRAPSLGTSDEAIEELQQLDHVHSVRQAAPQQQLSLVLPGQTISRQMAYRVMRDAVALQLARRGFDGLRGTALWLVAELAADFTRALGYQLGQVVVPSPYTDASLLPLVRRLQRHTLLSSPARR